MALPAVHGRPDLEVPALVDKLPLDGWQLLRAQVDCGSPSYRTIDPKGRCWTFTFRIESRVCDSGWFATWSRPMTDTHMGDWQTLGAWPSKTLQGAMEAAMRFTEPALRAR